MKTRRGSKIVPSAIACLLLLTLGACGTDGSEPDEASGPGGDQEVQAEAPTLGVESFDLGFAVGPLAVASDAVWVSDESDAVQRVDPATGQVVVGGELVSSDVSALATMGGVVWTGSTVDLPVTRVEVATGQTIATATSRSVSDIAVTSSAVWLNDDLVDAALRLDPTTLEVVASVPVGLPTGIAATEEAVWVTDEDGGLRQIDPETNQVVSTTDLAPGLTSVAAAGSTVWVADSYEMSRVDAGAAPTATRLELPESIGSLGRMAANEDGLWVLSESDEGSQVSLVSAETNSVVASVALDGSGGYIAVGDSGVWISYDESTFVSHVRLS